MKARIVTALVAIGLLAACGLAPDLNVKRYVAEKEIVGSWSLSPATLALAMRDGYTPAEGVRHEVTFGEDGTCDFRSITEFARKAEHLDFHGSWKLEHESGMPNQKKRKNELSIRIKDRRISLYLTEEEGRLLLWDF